MATRTISVAGGNWDALTTWDEGVKPVAGDAVVARAGGTSGNLTVNVPSATASIVLTNYTGTLTFNDTLTTTSTVTLVSGMTVAGTAGTLVVGSATITSGGKTLTCALSFGQNTVVLADDWVVNGLVTANLTSGSATLNGVGRKLTCAGGFSKAGTTASMSGTAKLVLTGGTWSSASTGSMQNSVDLQGNVTVSGAISYNTGTLKYVSGTITTTGSTLTCNVATTLDTAGVTWESLAFSGAVTYTLSSALAGSGTLTVSASATFSGAGAINWAGPVSVTGATVTLNNTGGLTTTGTMTLPNAAVTFAGSAGWTVGTLTNTAYTASRTVTLTQGNTYAVTTALTNVGTTTAIRQAIVSSTPGTKVVFNLTPGASCNLRYCDPTDVNSSGGATILSLDGVITTSLNWNGTYVTPTGPGGGRVLSSSIIQGQGA